MIKYYAETKYIWNNFVPKRGQADILQGELLRQIEKLRHEAKTNGNINWDDNFAYFCDFIDAVLKKSECIESVEMKKISDALAKIKHFGQTTFRYTNGIINDDEFLACHNNELEFYDCFAYCNDDIYDLIVDGIVLFYMLNRETIPYQCNPQIYR